MKVLQKNPKVALTLDGTVWPYKVLLMRGTARVTVMDGIVPEYALACKRYMGEEGAAGWLAQIGKMFTQMARIAVQPAWVGIIDFEQRFPSAIERAMAGAH